MHQEFGGAGVDRDRAGDAAVAPGQQPRRHVAVGDQHPRAAKLAVQRLLDGLAVRHRQHIGADVVHLLDREVAVLVLQEADAEAVELLDDRVAALGIFIDRLLIDDAVVGDGDFLGVLLRRRIAGNDRVVQPVHAHRDRAGALDVGLFEQNDRRVRVLQLRLERGHRPGGAAADHEHVALDLRASLDDLIHAHVVLSCQMRAEPRCPNEDRCHMPKTEAISCRPTGNWNERPA